MHFFSVAYIHIYTYISFTGFGSFHTYHFITRCFMFVWCFYVRDCEHFSIVINKYIDIIIFSSFMIFLIVPYCQIFYLFND